MWPEHLHTSVLWSVMSGQSNSSQSQAGAGSSPVRDSGDYCQRPPPQRRRKTGRPEEASPAAQLIRIPFPSCLSKGSSDSLEKINCFGFFLNYFKTSH